MVNPWWLERELKSAEKEEGKQKPGHRVTRLLRDLLAKTWRPSVLSQEADHKSNDRHHGKDEEQDLGDLDSACRDAAETEHGSDQCDDEKNNGVVQHLKLLALVNGLCFD